MFDMQPADRRKARADLETWAAQALRAIRAEAGPPAAPVEGWTPERAGAALVEALRWLRGAGGRVGPAGFGGMQWQAKALTVEEFLEAWGFLPESANDPDDAPPVRIQATAAQVTRHLDAIEWPARYLAGHDGSRQMVALWANCKAYRRPFNAAVKARGTIDRSLAYRLRDRGLSLISVALSRDGVPLDYDRRK